jgi:hypothetical protein
MPTFLICEKNIYLASCFFPIDLHPNQERFYDSLNGAFALDNFL